MKKNFKPNPITIDLIDETDCLCRVKNKLSFLYDVLIDPKSDILTTPEIIEGLGIIILEIFSQLEWLEKYLDNERKEFQTKIGELENKLDARKCA